MRDGRERERERQDQIYRDEEIERATYNDTDFFFTIAHYLFRTVCVSVCVCMNACVRA